MRAREFTINVPITIKINGDGDPEVDMQGDDAKDPQELDSDPVMVPPLQQDLELRKAEQGKDSPVIRALTQDEEELDDEDELTTFFKSRR